jgi:hypothetical protein
MIRIRFWLITHPRIARPVRVVGWLQLLACVAVGTAPQASASTNAVVLNWTGLHDSYGVPAGDLYLSLASVADQLAHTGPDASALDPTTWWPWMMHGLTVLFDSFAAANILTAEVGLAVGIFTLAMWVFRLTISTYWVTVLGELARAITTAVLSVTARWGLVAITVPIGVFMGVLAIRRGERGRGATLIMLALFLPALAVSVFSDPAGLMYGPNGLLQFGRRMAFSTAQAATHGGPISGGGFSGQVDTLTSSLITHVLREPLEVFNFGHVVDRVGGCGPLVSSAWKHGAQDGPITALAQCGDNAAVQYAQNLDGTNVLGGLVLLIAASLFGWFMVSAGASVFMVSVKAIYTTAKLLPSVFAGGIDGAAREHAKSTVWQYFKHPLEAMVYITFVSVMGLAIERLISRPLPAELGGANPFAHVLMTGAASLVALYLLRHIRADLSGSRPGRGVVGRAGDVALGLGMHAALGGAGTAAVGGVRGVSGLLPTKTPWEKIDEQAAVADPQQILGPAQDGFDPVPAGLDVSPLPSGDAGMGATAGGGGAGHTPAIPALDPSAPDMSPVMGVGGGARAQQRHGQPRGAALVQRSAPAGLEDAGPHSVSSSAPEVAPIAETGSQSDDPGHGTPLWASSVDHTAQVPLPWDAPPGDELPAPPPDDSGPPTATVDPITGH